MDNLNKHERKKGRNFFLGDKQQLINGKISLGDLYIHQCSITKWHHQQDKLKGYYPVVINTHYFCCITVKTF